MLRFLLPHPLFPVYLFAFVSLSATEQNLLPNSDLSTTEWTHLANAELTPSTEGTPARLVFPADDWGALRLRIPVGDVQLPDDLELALTYRIVDPVPAPRLTTLRVMSIGEDREVVPALGDPRANLQSNEWETVRLPVRLEPGAETLELRVSAHRQLQMEIQSIQLLTTHFTQREAMAFQQGLYPPIIYVAPNRALPATAKVTENTIQLRALPRREFRNLVGPDHSFIIDLGQPRPINFTHIRKHFWPHRTPADIDLSIYTGNEVNVENISESSDWQLVAELRDDDSHNHKFLEFEQTEARFLRLQILRTMRDEERSDFNEILIGLRPDLPIPEFTAQVEPGSIQLAWANVLGDGPTQFSRSEREDQISWNHNSDAGFYRVYRSSNLDDGFRVLNVEGEVLSNDYRDDLLIPGKTYYYQVFAYRENMRIASSEVVEVVAEQGERPEIEDGFWNVSAGRFSADDGIYHDDHIATFGNIGGFTYGKADRDLYLIYPSLGNREPWPDSFRLTGTKQNNILRETLNLGFIKPSGVDGTPRYEVSYSGWDSMSYTMHYPNGEAMTVYMNGLMPALTLESPEPSLSFFGNSDSFGTPSPAWVAFSRDGRMVVHPVQGDVDLRGMDRSWLIFWWGDGKVSLFDSVDLPIMFTLSKRPTSVSLNESGEVELKFAENAGKISLMPLYGMEKVSTADWSHQLPAAVAERADFWSARLKHIPFRARDRFTLEEEENRLFIEMTYDYLEARDEWNTRPVALAPVAPSTAFVKSRGYPVQYISDIKDQGFSCYGGPFQAVEFANKVEYYLPAEIDAFLNGFDRQIARPELLEHVRETLNVEETVRFIAERGPHIASWRPRYIDLEILQYFDAHILLSPETQPYVERIADEYLEVNRYFDLDTYEFRRDRYSGKKYVISKDPDCRFSLTVDYAFGVGGALWTFYRYAETLDRWDVLDRHWESVLQYNTSFETGIDWNSQSPPGMKYYNDWGGNPDYLNSYLAGQLALARMAHRLGDEKTHRRAVYQFSITFLTLYHFKTIQYWIHEHQPHFSPPYRFYADTHLQDIPEKGFGGAPEIHGVGAIYRFINSNTPNLNYVHYPTVRVNPDLAVFWDLYLREEYEKTLYRDRGLITENGIDGHAIQARAYLFENDPDVLQSWIDRATRENGDWGFVNHYSTYLTMLLEPPVAIQAPNPKYVQPGYEERIAGKDMPTTLLEFKEVVLASEDLESFLPKWRIGQPTNSGQGFSKDSMHRNSLLRLLLEENPELTQLQAERMARGIGAHPRIFESVINNERNRIFVIGESSDRDWQYQHNSAFRVLRDGGVNYDSRPHPRRIHFDLTEDINPNGEYRVIIDLHRLSQFYPAFITVEVNGERQSVRVPLPFYASYSPLPPIDDEKKEVILSFPIKPEWLRQGKNEAVITVQGTGSIFYDWLGFGVFE